MARNVESYNRMTAAVISLHSNNPELHIQKYTALTPKNFPVPCYEIVCNHAPNNYSEKQYAESVYEMFDGRLALVADTVTPIEYFGNEKIVSMIVHSNVPSVPYTEEGSKGLIPIRANIFQDQDDKIWKVSGEGDTKRLVQVSDDDLEEILASRQSRRVITAAMKEDTALDFKNGDFVLYFCPANLQVRSGIVYTTKSGTKVLDREFDKPIDVYSNLQILEAVSNYGEDENTTIPLNAYQVNATLTSEMGTKIVEYMRRMFSNTEFFNRLEALVRQRRSMGNEGLNSHTSPQINS